MNTMSLIRGCAPLLIMDVFEHAFMLDYGLKRRLHRSLFQEHQWRSR